MLADTNIYKTLYETKQLTNSGHYSKACEILCVLVGEFERTADQNSVKDAAQLFELYRHWYEASTFILPSVESKDILDKLYIWAKYSGNELWGRLELLEHAVRYQEQTLETARALAEEYALLAQDAFAQNNVTAGIWAANKYFKLAPAAAIEKYALDPQQILDRAQAAHMPEAILWLKHHYGIMAEQQKKYVQAKQWFEESLELSYLLNQKDGIKWNSYNLGRIFLEQEHNKQRATDLFAQAMSIAHSDDGLSERHKQLLQQSIRDLSDHTILFNRLMVVSKYMASEVHELKNMVVGWQLTIDNLLSELSLEQAAAWRFAQSLKTQTVSLRTKLADLLALVRGKESLAGSASVDLVVFVAAFVDFARQLVRDHTACIEFTHAGVDHVVVPIPETVLQQVLLNLLLNAVEVVQSKAVIAIAVDAQGGLRFIDNGPGVPAAQQDKLFQAFYTTKENGTGIGLFTVQQLLQKYGYDIQYESGHAGACFVITKMKE